MRAKQDSTGDAVDGAFDKLLEPALDPGKAPAVEPDATVASENRAMFRQILPDRAQLVRDFIIELGVGATTRRWIDIAKPELSTLTRAAASVSDDALEKALGEFERAVDAVARGSKGRVAGADRDAVLAAYGELVKAFPEVFAIEAEQRAREAVLVRYLLLQVPGVSNDALARLADAGLGTLAALCGATHEQLVAAGLDEECAPAVVARVQAYWKERTEHPIERAQERAKQKLHEVVERLSRAHRDFERAEADEDRDRKRRARGDRRARALELNVWLAQLGEVDLVAELERSATEQRIERARSYIQHLPRLIDPHHQEAL